MSENDMRTNRHANAAAYLSGNELPWRSRMDERTIEVEYRLDEIRRASAGIHAEREADRRHGGGAFSGLRVAIGRRLVAVGTALQDGAAPTAHPAAH